MGHECRTRGEKEGLVISITRERRGFINLRRGGQSACWITRKGQGRVH